MKNLSGSGISGTYNLKDINITLLAVSSPNPLTTQINTYQSTNKSIIPIDSDFYKAVLSIVKC
jgi:hypothetical protein